MKPILFAFFFLIATLVLAQENKNGNADYLDDTVFDFIYKSNPMIEVSYGVGLPSDKNISSKFANIGSWDIKLGKSEQKNFKGPLVNLCDRYIFASFLSSTTQDFYSTNHKILTDSYQFGFGLRSGVGYGGSVISVVPYVSQSIVWTKLVSYETQSPLESGNLDKSEILDNYLGTFRFGDKANYGMKIEVGSTFQVNTYYETSVVYRRHLFWYWSGSLIVSQTGYILLSNFTDEIIDNSPILGPIFNFALKAGYLYAYHLLREKNMNWPFNTSSNEAPLTFETFNIGFGFVF